MKSKDIIKVLKYIEDNDDIIDVVYGKIPQDISDLLFDCAMLDYITYFCETETYMISEKGYNYLALNN